MNQLISSDVTRKLGEQNSNQRKKDIVQSCSDDKVDKSFECDICKSLFKYKQSLKRHIISVHEKKKGFKCNICTDTFDLSSYLKKHVAAVHEGRKCC